MCIKKERNIQKKYLVKRVINTPSLIQWLRKSFINLGVFPIQEIFQIGEVKWKEKHVLRKLK